MRFSLLAGSACTSSGARLRHATCYVRVRVPKDDVISRNGRTPTPGDPQDRSSSPVLFVVDDDVPTLELLREVARESGWQTVGFTRLAPLRAALARRRPTFLIVDDDLPDGRGGDLVRDLRDDPGLEDVPLVVCTAAAPRRRAEITAWAPVISKPFDLGELEDLLTAAALRGGGRAYHGAAG
jgi:CheY-like chemotaxis protein